MASPPASSPGSDATADLKVVILGDRGVGKTSIAKRYIHGTFKESEPATIAACFFSKRISLRGRSFRLQIWDTAGQERFRSMAPMYYRGAHIALLVCDVTEAESLDSIRHWTKELSEKTDQVPKMCLVGNKADIAEPKWQLTREHLQGYAQQQRATYVEVSAKTGAGIDDLFSSVLRSLDLDGIDQARSGSADMRAEKAGSATALGEPQKLYCSGCRSG